MRDRAGEIPGNLFDKFRAWTIEVSDGEAWVVGWAGNIETGSSMEAAFPHLSYLITHSVDGNVSSISRGALDSLPFCSATLPSTTI